MCHLTRNSLRIVQVDDCEDFIQITEIFLKERGFAHAIAAFNSGKKAVDYLSKIDRVDAPNVILLDLNMPGMNGLAVLGWLRKSYRDRAVPIIFLTSSECREDKRRAMEAGATKYLEKTALYSRLIGELDEAIDTSNHRSPEDV